MKKDLYWKDLNEIKNITGKIRTIAEAISFGDEYDDYEGGPDQEMGGEERLADMQGQEADPEENPEDVGMKNLDQAGELDQIREITLKGMIKFCKNPEDPTYQALKKIFTMVDKGVEKETKEQEQMRR